MKHATLLRLEQGDQGTFGILVSSLFRCFISELPWRDNAKQVSCIPAGIYEVKWRKSRKFGWCYEVTGVPGRANILIHIGNYVGDVGLSFRSNSYGCLLPAKRLGYLRGQKAGLLSGPAVASLNSFFNKESFLLEIKNADHSIGDS